MPTLLWIHIEGYGDLPEHKDLTVYRQSRHPQECLTAVMERCRQHIKTHGVPDFIGGEYESGIAAHDLAQEYNVPAFLIDPEFWCPPGHPCFDQRLSNWLHVVGDYVPWKLSSPNKPRYMIYTSGYVKPYLGFKASRTTILLNAKEIDMAKVMMGLNIL